VGTSEVGADGVVDGVTDSEVVDSPAPAPLIADTLNMYCVPLVSPVTVCEAVVEGVRVNMLQVDPLFDEYSTL
jgi:hypothetical protein